jgi:hydrogenase/urease accessory protein HupE
VNRSSLVVAFLVVLALPGVVLGHEVRPGYLEIGQTGEETFDVYFKVPARGDLRLSLYARLPERCQARTPVRTRAEAGAFIDRWSVTCTGGLVGETIRIEGLSATLTDVLVRLERADGTTQIARLTPDTPSFVVEAIPSAWSVAGTYLALGVEHILLGIDHLLFVLALLLLVEGWRRLVATITSFTVAHSITLAGASLGLVHIPQRPVEAVIALSIVFVAAEIVHHRQGRPSLARSQPWIVAFSFGLLHGLGFAGALSEIGLPEQSIPLALLFFNVGVEIGQLLFIAAMLALGAMATRAFSSVRPAWAWQTVSAYGIGAVAAFWTLERVVGLW